MTDTPTMGTMLHRAAANFGDNEALVFGTRSVTYRQLDRRVNQLSNALQAHGVSKGGIVVVLAKNHPEFLEAHYACARLGAVLCPVNYRLAAREVAEILNSLHVQVLMLDRDHVSWFRDAIAPSLESTAYPVVCFGESTDTGLSYEAFIKPGRSAEPNPPYPVDSSDAVVMLHTSGTSGLPKGALISQASTVWCGIADMRHFPWSRDDRLLQSMPFMHVGGLHMLTTAALYQGIPVVIQPQWDAEEAVETISRNRCSALWLQERILDDLVEVAAERPAKVASLKKLMTAAGPGSSEFVDSVMRTLALDEIRYMYGLTEAAGTVSMTDSTEDLVGRPGNMGRPVFFEDIRLIDESGSPVAVGEPGELLLRGPNVFLGYHGMADATEAALQDGWLRTGDLIRMDDDGCLFFVDRKKDMVKSGGENVFPADVEPRLLAVNPSLTDLAIVGVPSPEWGEEVVAFAVVRPGATCSDAEIRERGRTVLGGFKLPKRVIFLEEIPRTPVGRKVRRAELRELALRTKPS